MRLLLLRGRDQPELGSVAAAADGAIALALSRGGARKPYPHTDPNEDAALAVDGAHGTLVAVADGHWGARAAEVALEHLRDVHAKDWVSGRERTAERWYQDVLHACVGANDAVLAIHTEEARPRTTLALALARPDEDVLVAASCGDSLLFVSEPAGTVAELLTPARRPAFLGTERWTPSQLERSCRIDVRGLGAAAALVAVTDGLSEQGIGVEEPEQAVRAALASGTEAGPARRAPVAARALVDAALAAHAAHDAGDNVAAAVGWVER